MGSVPVTTCRLVNQSGSIVTTLPDGGAVGRIGAPIRAMNRPQFQYGPGSQCWPAMHVSQFSPGTLSWPRMCALVRGMPYLAVSQRTRVEVARYICGVYQVAPSI